MLADLSDARFDKTKTPNAPPKRQATIPTGISITNWNGSKRTPIMTPKIKIPKTWVNATKLSPTIFPKIIVYLEIGETKISWEKSLARSSINEISPEAVD